jgi:hypothetical protein
MSDFDLDMNERVTWRRDNEAEVVRRGGAPIVAQGAGTLFDALAEAAFCPAENRSLFKIWRTNGEEISGGRLAALVCAPLSRTTKVVRSG